MTPKQAKAELKQIMTQKTVSISRLEKILDVLDYEKLEKQYIEQAFAIKRHKQTIRQLEKKRGIKNGKN